MDRDMRKEDRSERATARPGSCQRVSGRGAAWPDWHQEKSQTG